MKTKRKYPDNESLKSLLIYWTSLIVSFICFMVVLVNEMPERIGVQEFIHGNFKRVPLIISAILVTISTLTRESVEKKKTRIWLVIFFVLISIVFLGVGQFVLTKWDMNAWVWCGIYCYVGYFGNLVIIKES